MPIKRTVMRLLAPAVLTLVAANTSYCRGEATRVAKDDSTSGLKYGFRYDPMKWIENDKSLEGGRVRAIKLPSPLIASPTPRWRVKSAWTIRSPSRSPSPMVS